VGVLECHILTRHAEESAWDEFVQNHPEGSIFHTLLWRDAMLKAFPWLEPVYVYCEDRKSNLKAVLPSFYVPRIGLRILGAFQSLPFKMYGKPLYDSTEALNALVNFLYRIVESRKATSICISMFPRLKPFELDIFGGLGRLVAEPRITQVLDLDEDFPSLLLHKFNKKCRYALRKAQSKVIVVRGTSTLIRTYLQLKERYFFDKILALAVKKALCSLLLKRRIAFEKMNTERSFLSSLASDARNESLKIYVAYLDRLPISASVFLYYKKVVHYWDSVTLPSYYKYNAGNLIIAEAVKDALANGMRKMNLHESPSESSGIFKFKESFGAVPLRYYVIRILRYRCPYRNFMNYAGLARLWGG